MDIRGSEWLGRGAADVDHLVGILVAAIEPSFAAAGGQGPEPKGDDNGGTGDPGGSCGAEC